MKKIFLISTLLLCGLYAVAQTSPSQGSNPSSSQYPSTSGQSSTATSNQSSSDHHMKVRGCLSGSSGNYTLTDKSGNAYQLAGDTSKLTEHVGHTVEITGTESSPSSGSSGATSSASGTSSTKTLDVTSVKHISPSCSTSH